MKNKILVNGFIMVSLLLIFTQGCKVEPEFTVTTDRVSEITSTSATCIGSIHSGEANSYGFTWSKLPGLPENQSYNKSPAGSGDKEFTGEFSVSLTDLTPGTTYYVRAYAFDYRQGAGYSGTTYGDVITFTTKGSVSRNMATDKLNQLRIVN
jgi:hypothetical protein